MPCRAHPPSTYYVERVPFTDGSNGNSHFTRGGMVDGPSVGLQWPRAGKERRANLVSNDPQAWNFVCVA